MWRESERMREGWAESEIERERDIEKEDEREEPSEETVTAELCGLNREKDK